MQQSNLLKHSQSPGSKSERSPSTLTEDTAHTHTQLTHRKGSLWSSLGPQEIRSTGLEGVLGEDTLTGGDDPLDLRCLPVHPSNASPDDQVVECSACMDNFPKAYPVCG